MNRVKTLRVGIVGGGGIVYPHLGSMRKINDVRVVAVCDKNEAMARRVADRFGIRSYYTELAQMLDKEEMEVVDICTPPPTHPALAIQAMKAGRHVLTEKPMALTLEEADEMIETARASQVQLCVVHNQLFIPVVIKAREMVASGVVGEVMGISITDAMPRDGDLIWNKEHWCHKLPGGIFGEMLPHPLYLAQAFLGQLRPAAVYSRRLSNRDWLLADELRVVLEGRDSLVTITASVNWPDDLMLLDIFGTKMSLHVDLWGLALTRYAVAGGGGRFARGRQNLELGFQRLAGTAGNTARVISGRFHGGHFTLIRRFLESVRSGIGIPVTVEEAREAVRLYQAVTARVKPAE
jgi:predicted dehydrogenase